MEVLLSFCFPKMDTDESKAFVLKAFTKWRFESWWCILGTA